MGIFAKPQNFFLIFGAISVLLLALLTPPFQTPDEQQHLLRAFQLSELRILPHRQGVLAGDVMPRSIGDSAQAFLQLKERHNAAAMHPIPLSFTKAEMARPLNASDRTFQEFLTLYFPTGYAPQVVGVWIGRALGFGPVGLLLAARVLNGLFCVGIIGWALRVMPAGAPAALFVAMLPTSLAAMGSASPDGSTIATSILLAAFAIRAVMGLPAVAGMAAAVSAVCVSKFAYMPLAVAGAAGGPMRARARHLVLGVAAGVVVLVWLKLTASGIVELRPNTDVAGQARYVLGHPFAFLTTIGRTFIEEGGRFRMEVVGVLGWLNVFLPVWLYPLANLAFCLSLVAHTPAVRFPKSALAWWVILAVASIVLIFLAIYLPWSPVGFPYVEGMQGRYFVPFLPLLGGGVSAALSTIEADRLRRALYGVLLAYLVIQAGIAIWAVVHAFGVLT